MVIVDKCPYDESRVTLKFNYAMTYIQRVKRVKGYRYDSYEKLWTIPIKYLDNLEKEFKGELVYKTPKWVLDGSKAPDYKNLYKVNNNLPIPAHKIKPYSHQEFGFRFMIKELYNEGFVINSDDVGIGKTNQAILVIKHLTEHCNVKKILILCKKSLKRQWKEEIEKFIDISLPIAYTKDTKKSRTDAYKSVDKEGILITNYNTVLNDESILVNMGFDLIIIDEAHVVSSKDAKMNASIKKICKKVKYKIPMTGTPIMGKLEDLYGLMDMINPGFFGPYKDFKKDHIITEWNGSYEKFIGYKGLDDIRELVQKHIIRRTEFEVDIDMPQVSYKTFNVDMDKVQADIQNILTNELRDSLNLISDLMSKSVKEKDPDKKKDLGVRIGKGKNHIKALKASFQAVADDPRLFNMSENKHIKKKYGSLVPTTYKMSTKTESFLDVIDDIITNDDKVVVFCEFEREVRMLSNDIEKKFKGVKVAKYSGTMDDDERDESVELFKKVDDYKVFIATKAAEEGWTVVV